MNYKTFFRGKRIAIVGLGLHGEMVADIKFLLKAGAEISVYDMRSELRLQGFLAPLREIGFDTYTFGKVPADELVDKDLIIIAPEVSRKSTFLKKAIHAGVRVEYPDVLFLKMVPPLTLIGVMGECGKTTIVHMLYRVLKEAFAEYEDQGLYLLDSTLSAGALTHLRKVKGGDVVLVRISEDMMDEYAQARLSPHVAIITSPVTRTSFAILEPQTYNNFVVAPDTVVDAIKKDSKLTTKAKLLRTKSDNKALVLQAAELFKVNLETARESLEMITGLKGHRELVKKINGVEYYNDAASATPLATVTALRSFSVDKNIVLIIGGAYTGHDYAHLIKEIPLYAKMVILIPGSGSLGLRGELEQLSGIAFLQARTLEDAVALAHKHASKGDRVLFSPAFEAIGVHSSRKERGEKFVKAVRGL